MKDLSYQLVKVIHLDPNNTSYGRRVRTRMSQPNLHLKAFDQNYTLYLEENDNVLLGSRTPVFIAEVNSRRRSAYSDDAGIVYSRIQYVRMKTKLVDKIFESLDQFGYTRSFRITAFTRQF